MSTCGAVWDVDRERQKANGLYSCMYIRSAYLHPDTVTQNQLGYYLYMYSQGWDAVFVH